MKTLILMFDYLNGPIFKNVFSESKNKLVTGIDLIDNNKKINELNDKIMDMFSSYYNFDDGEKGCSFDTKLAIKQKSELESLIKKLIEMINQINDGSFVVENRIDLNFEK